jgi:UDP-N-acetylglucosamine 2-epimerase (non-hydrolysing)
MFLDIIKKMKILTIVGTRPEIIKLSRVIAELDKNIDHILVHTGQNYDYELNEIFFEELGIRKPDYFLNSVGETLAKTIANIIAKTDDILEKVKPDAILILGDTNSCLGIMGAKRRKIPIFHMEAGNRCFDLRVPEEINRKVVDHLSDVNLVYTEHARRYLIAEGLRPELIIKTGSPMMEVLHYYEKKINSSNVLSRLGLEKNQYFLVSTHREENIDNSKNFEKLLKAIQAIEEKYKFSVIVSTHPRTRKKLEEQKDISFNIKIKFLNPLGFPDYVKLQQNAATVISDSGTISEESSILNFPAITIRQQHERPEGMDEGTLIMCGLETESILNAIDIVISQQSENRNIFKIVSDYDTENVSKKVLRIILSYTDYINRKVWFKY